MKINSGGFEPVSSKAWKQKIQADLKGGDYNELLTWISPEDITVKPFYNAEDMPQPSDKIVTPSADPWKIGHICEVGVENAVSLAQEALENGAEQLLVNYPKDADDTLGKLTTVKARKWVDMHDFNEQSLRELGGVSDPSSRWIADPIGTLTATGNWAESMETDMGLLGKFQSQAGDRAVLGIHANRYQNGGATRVQELAYTLAHGDEYLKKAEMDQGLKPLLENPVFLVAVGGEYFFEIAKLRALRRLWELLATTYGYSGKCCIIAMPSHRNKTLYDYNTNMLRSTTECMAAVLGGADVICNLPYDSLYHDPNRFADRIARNQLLLLRHESYFSAVSNPADGAYYIEFLTDQLGKKALDYFKKVDHRGGLLRQLKEHQIQKKIRESAEKEQLDFNEGRLVLVGSNKYPNPDDRMKGELHKNPFLPRRSDKTLIEPIFPRRLSEAYEQKRLMDEQQ
jgi:methylmalonyl-CoA mutase